MTFELHEEIVRYDLFSPVETEDEDEEDEYVNPSIHEDLNWKAEVEELRRHL